MQWEFIATGSRLDRIRGDQILKDTKMSRFIVSNFLNALVSRVGKSGFGENRGIKGLNALLVEGGYDTFGGEEVLEEKVIAAGRAGGSVQDGPGDVAGKGRGGAVVGTVEG